MYSDHTYQVCTATCKQDHVMYCPIDRAGQPDTMQISLLEHINNPVPLPGLPVLPVPILSTL